MPLISLIFSCLTIFQVICWNNNLYLWITFCFTFSRRNLWIITTLRVNSQREMFLLIIILRIVSCPGCYFLSAKTGTSFCIVWMIRMSILLMYSLKLRTCEDSLCLRSLVIGWLPPNSEAKMLTLSNLATTLSFRMKVECALRFLIPELMACDTVCSANYNWFFLRLGMLHDAICVCLRLLLVLVKPDFLVDCEILCNGCWTLLMCPLILLSFLNADAKSSFADGPSVLILLSLYISGVKVFL